MNILAIGAHFDDVELGCGGSLLKWEKEEHKIFIYVATLSGYSAPDGRVIRSNEDARREGLLSAKKLNAHLIEGKFSTFEIEANEALHQSLINTIGIAKPDLIITHWDKDTHHDHRVLSLATLHVSRKINKLLISVFEKKT